MNFENIKMLCNTSAIEIVVHPKYCNLGVIMRTIPLC